MDFSIIQESWPIYFDGLVTTVWLTVAALVIGLLLAVPLAVVRVQGGALAQAPIRAFVYFFRGTPLLIQMFLIYYGLGQFQWMQQSVLWSLFSEAWFCALLAFALNTCAYSVEIIRGAIVATSPGEIEAARACGMSRMLMLRRIILPSAFRRALPAYSNEMIFMLHGTALASTVTIVDITGAARIIQSRYYSPWEAFLTAALLYMCLTFTIVFFVRRLEKHWQGHLLPARVSDFE